MNNLYAENKWARWYLELCHSRQLLGRKKLKCSHPDYVYYESHHIDASKLGGSDDPSNLVLLTPREHIWAHILMPKALLREHHQQMMGKAIDKMKGRLSKFVDGKEFFDSRLYELVKVENNRRGMPQSVRDKIRATMTGQKHSHERVEANRRAQIGKTQSAESNEKRRLNMLGKNVGPKTEPHRKRLSKSKSKFFIFFDPEGRLRLGDNLLAFCQELGLNQSRMNGLRKHGYPYKNWSVPLL